MAGYRLLVSLSVQIKRQAIDHVLQNPQLVDVMPATEIKGDESWASFMATFIRTEVLYKSARSRYLTLIFANGLQSLR